jgi:hypothetical protein
MGVYQRGENWYIDFRFKGQRIREYIGPSRKSAEKIGRDWSPSPVRQKGINGRDY